MFFTYPIHKYSDMLLKRYSWLVIYPKMNHVKVLMKKLMQCWYILIARFQAKFRVYFKDGIEVHYLIMTATWGSICNDYYFNEGEIADSCQWSACQV